MIRYLLAGFILVNSGMAFGNPDLEIIREKAITEILQSRVNVTVVKDLMGSLRDDGTWPGIDYKDVSRTGFQHSRHLSNLVTLCQAYKKTGSEFTGNTRLRKIIYSALDYWLVNDFICDNWWHNQIGTPDQFVKVLLIMDQDLSMDQITKSLAIAYRANLGASGARPSGDRIKIAGILAKNALFQRNDSLFDSTIRVIAGEIKFSTGRGMQYDYSFHHREDRVTSTLSYGMGYADAFAEWAALVSGTVYSFPASALNLLIDYYLDGICQTMVYGKYPDPGAENRSISRKGSLHSIGSSTPERLLAASSHRKEELEKIVKIRDGEMEPDLSCARFYWDSEYFSFQRPDYFTSVRMFSSRNHSMEIPYNSEGLLNHHYADGSNFISRTGEEYYDIFPVYDWQKIPGTTILQKRTLPPETEIQKKGLTDFVGAVSDGIYGAAAFDFISPLDPLKAKKAWFFFDKEYVCLGAGISSGSDSPIATTINQCLLKGDVIVMSGNSKSVMKHGECALDNVKWILHDSVAYLFPQSTRVGLQNHSEKGSWYLINQQSDSPKEEVTIDVFKLWIEHGARPENANYQYIVVPSTSEKEMTGNVSNRNIKILSNTSEIQAVMNSGSGICQIVFYKAAEIRVAPDIVIGLDSPGLAMVRVEGHTIKSISVSDPSRSLKRIHLTVSVKIEKTGAGFSSVWHEGKGMTDISIDLPVDEYSGNSFTIHLADY